jgi:hypothetical protein
MRNPLRTLLLAAPLAFAACGHATILEQSYVDPRGGVLVLHGDEEKAFEDAHARMAAHCGAGKYQILRRAQEVVGSEAYATSQTQYGQDEAARNAGASETTATPTGSATETSGAERRQIQGGSTTTEVSGVREVRETRITYACLP